MQAPEGLRLIGDLCALLFWFILKGTSPKDTDIAFIDLAKFGFNGLGRKELVRTGNSPNFREPGFAFQAHLLLVTCSLFQSVFFFFFVSQVPIPMGCVSSQVSDGKGSDKLIPMEDLGDNELKGPFAF